MGFDWDIFYCLTTSGSVCDTSDSEDRSSGKVCSYFETHNSNDWGVFFDSWFEPVQVRLDAEVFEAINAEPVRPWLEVEVLEARFTLGMGSN